MVIAALVLLGLVFGSFVNAFVWRLRQQELSSPKSKAQSQQYSILKGRSMCVHCHHELAAKDLVPVFSWLWLKGKCRYCQKPISVQYPLVEVSTALLFAISYVSWPHAVQGAQIAAFALWLVIAVGLMALLVYDLKWMLLPDKIVFPLTGIAAVLQLVNVLTSANPSHTILAVVVAAVIGGGLFYVLFQASQGKWIGGGDVKLGFLLGLAVGSAGKSILFIFLASLLGSIISVPLLVSGRLKRTSTLPFGPLLIVGGTVAVLYGDAILHWYSHVFLLQG